MAATQEQQDLIDLLIDGARYGDLEDVESALAQNVGIDSRDEGGRTGRRMALHLHHLGSWRRLPLMQRSTWRAPTVMN